jgi:hypothetical protein
MRVPLVLPNHQMWRLQYREDRYARHLSQVELNGRIRDILLNQLVVTEHGKVGLISIDEETRHWPEIWTHVLEEMRLRHGPYPAGFTREVLHSEPFPDLAGELAAKAAKVLSTLGGSRDVFVRYSKREYIEALVARGALRIQPASAFRNPDHNGAVRDDELALVTSGVLSRDDIVRLVRNPQDVPPDAKDHRFEVKFKAAGNYWMYCLSTAIAPRLFVDFGADACVVIHDRKAFQERLRNAAAGPLRATVASDGAATYVDPLRPRSAQLSVPMAKHFRYSYQREYRFVWHPRSPTEQLSHVDVELGPLGDIADLILL